MFLCCVSSSGKLVESPKKGLHPNMQDSEILGYTKAFWEMPGFQSSYHIYSMLPMIKVKGKGDPLVLQMRYTN